MAEKYRMQGKAVICLIGIILLFFIVLRTGEKTEEKQPEPQISTVQNAYVVEASKEELTLYDGTYRTYAVSAQCEYTGSGRRESELCGRVVDVTLTDGVVTWVCDKADTIVSGKLLSAAKEDGIVLEGYGQIPFAEQVAYYVLYGELRTGRCEDLRIGYAYADFLLSDGKIYAVLLARDDAMDTIRVLLKTDDYAANIHKQLTISCNTDYVVKTATEERSFPAGEQITVTPQEAAFSEEGAVILVTPAALTGKITLHDVHRSQGAPSYRGSLELRRSEEGIVAVNELLLEEYLYAVVPSEMPASYPAEALKAQAICARTYAYAHMQNPGLPQYGAHVDDSTAYQVYNNIEEQAAATVAVKETAGLLLTYGGQPAATYYYSTSCGFGSDERVWDADREEREAYLTAGSVSRAALMGEETAYTAEKLQEEEAFSCFLVQPDGTDFEKEEPWYRWTYTAVCPDEERMLSLLQSRYQVSPEKILQKEGDDYVSKPVEKLGKIQNIAVVGRNAGGVAQSLLIEGSEADYLVLTELNIRYVLCDGKTSVRRQDGSMIEMKSLLPSAFFIISTVQDGENMVGYEISGGGFGHGVGMSQNGAKCMAKEGCSAEQILTFFYRGTSVSKVGEN